MLFAIKKASLMPKRLVNNRTKMRKKITDGPITHNSYPKNKKGLRLKKGGFIFRIKLILLSSLRRVFSIENPGL